MCHSQRATGLTIKTCWEAVMAKRICITNVVKFGQKFIAGVSTKVVSAEDLHSWLGVKKPF